MKKKERPKFFAMYKDFNSGEIRQVDVLRYVFDRIFDYTGHIKKRTFTTYDWTNKKYVYVTTKELLGEYIKIELMSVFSGQCQWEMVGMDWPYSTRTVDYPKPVMVTNELIVKIINQSRPIKIDVYQQIKPNLSIIVNLVWDYMGDKIDKFSKKLEKTQKKQ